MRSALHFRALEFLVVLSKSLIAKFPTASLRFSIFVEKHAKGVVDGLFGGVGKRLQRHLRDPCLVLKEVPELLAALQKQVAADMSSQQRLTVQCAKPCENLGCEAHRVSPWSLGSRPCGAKTCKNKSFEAHRMSPCSLGSWPCAATPCNKIVFEAHWVTRDADAFGFVFISGD
jgi:hypothetical protein